MARQDLIQYNDGFDNASKSFILDAAHQTIKTKREEGYLDARLEFARLQKALLFFSEMQKELKSDAIDDCEQYHDDNVCTGVRLDVVGGASRLNLDEDPIYADLKRQLKERESLLRLAEKSSESIFDSSGSEVPKVSKTVGAVTLKATIL